MKRYYWPYEVSDWPPGHIVTDVPLSSEKIWPPALPPMHAPMPRHTLRKRFCKWCGSKLQAPPNEVTTYDEYTGKPIEPRAHCLNQKCPGKTTVKW